LESRARPGPLALSDPSGERHIFDDGGFCTIRSLPSACRRRVAALMLQFPPFGGALDVGRARPCTSHSAIPSVWWRCHWKAGRARARSRSLTLPESVASLTMGGFAPLEASRRRVAGVSRLYWCNSPRLVAVRSRFGAVRSRFGAAWRPNRRPPRRQTPTMGGRGRGGLRFGQNCLRHGVLFARRPLNLHVSLLVCT